MAEPKNFYGRYHRVNTQIWSDPAFANLPPTVPNSRYLYIWLLAGQQATILPGVVIAGPMAVAEILDWDLDPTKATLYELVEAGLVLMDPKARLIYVRRSLADNPPANPNVIAGWETSWSEIAPCQLKERIWVEFEAHARGRGDSFLESFITACPRGNGYGNGSRDGSGNGSANRNRNKNQDQSLYLPQKHSPEQNNGQGPSLVPSGSTSGVGDRGIEDTGQETGTVPGYPSGEGPGLQKDSGPGYTSRGAPGSPSEYGLGPTPDTVPGGHPCDSLECPRSPSSGRESTFDDIDWDDDSVPASSISTPPTSEAEGSRIPDPAQKILDAWNTQVAEVDPIFEAVKGQDAVNLVAGIMKHLERPRAVLDFQALFEIIPQDPFYSGTNTTKFIAFLRHYITMAPEGLGKCGDIARAKLAKLHRKPGSKPKSKSETDAQAARERQKAYVASAPTGNNIIDLLRS